MLEATGSLSSGEQHTCLECQGLYSACLGLTGFACASPELFWVVPWLRTTEGSGLLPWVKVEKILKAMEMAAVTLSVTSEASYPPLDMQPLASS